MLREFVDPQDDLWSNSLRGLRHDFYHLPEYAQLCADHYPGGLPRAFIAQDEDGLFFVPLILRPIIGPGVAPSLLDTVVPYGYASPIVSTRRGCDVEAFMTRALDALTQCLLTHGVVTAFFRLHPMLELPLQLLRRYGSVVEHGETVYCDLSASPEELWRETRLFMRKRIVSARSAGCVVEIDKDWESLDDFYELYIDTMRRVNASEFYMFDREYFNGLRDLLGEKLHLLVVRLGDAIICGGIFSETSGIVQYHLSGTRHGFEKSDASKVLIDFARLWFKERGNRVLHLGGGVGAENDSLFFFKSGFSKHRCPFHTWRVVIDPATYGRLVERWRTEAGASTESPRGYFPEYRVERPYAKL